MLDPTEAEIKNLDYHKGEDESSIPAAQIDIHAGERLSGVIFKTNDSPPLYFVQLRTDARQDDPIVDLENLPKSHDYPYLHELRHIPRPEGENTVMGPLNIVKAARIIDFTRCSARFNAAGRATKQSKELLHASFPVISGDDSVKKYSPNPHGIFYGM